MDEQQKIMSMMVLAEDQQKAAQTTLDALGQQIKGMASIIRTETRAGMLEIEGKTVSAFQGHEKAIGKAVNDAHGAAEAIQESIKSVGWKLALVAFLAAFGAIAAFAIGAYGLVAWQSYQVRSLASEKADLVQEVARLEAAAADFAKRAGKANLITCGDQRRLCVEIDTKAGGFGEHGQYAIIKGY